MYGRIIEYFEAVKSGATIAPFFSSDATISSHKLGKVCVAEYERRLAQTPADIEKIRICNWRSDGCLVTASIQIDLRPGIELQYVDIFEFNEAAIIRRLYLCRVSPHTFDGNSWVVRL
ncbi:hypothetical protein PSP31121_00580 [Pandoraea sputorum]|uniref:SnoaL-like domain-containing protein n=1 Tax=Pandoraea sputorum TaxID=93222 RepID=A0A5E5ATB4_9BURK|nr:hypothetical protein PSP31121_00580 [Pandoraea sputorum]